MIFWFFWFLDLVCLGLSQKWFFMIMWPFRLYTRRRYTRAKMITLSCTPDLSYLSHQFHAFINLWSQASNCQGLPLSCILNPTYLMTKLIATLQSEWVLSHIFELSSLMKNQSLLYHEQIRSSRLHTKSLTYQQLYAAQ